jgi:transposase
MNTSPYSNDLREKVIKYIKGGGTQASAVKLFDLNASTVGRWWLRYKSEGHYSPRIRPGKRPSVTLEQIEEYVKLNADFTSVEMGKHFNMTGSGALYWLKKLGFSYKKKLSPTWKRKKKSGIDT